MQRVERVHADAALEAGAGELPEPALHLVLHHQVGRALGDVQKAVDALAGERRDRRRKLRVAHRQVVGLGHGVDRRANDRVIDRLVDELAKK